MQFRIENMTCGGCARSVTKAVETVDPKAKINADPVTKKVTIDSALSSDVFSRAPEDAGYPAVAA